MVYELFEGVDEANQEEPSEPLGGSDGERWRGAPAGFMAPWARWHRVYVQAKGRTTGVVMLLVSRIGPPNT